MDETQILKKSFERDGIWAEWSAWAIIGGLALEVCILLWFSKDRSSFETLSLVASNGIIAAGVFGEIHFGRRVTNASKRLQQISDEEVALANARASEANQKAQEAILELAKFRAPRILTPEQRGRIAEKLKRFSGTEYDIAISLSEPEILDFVFLVEVALSTAEWIELDWQGTGEGLIREGSPIIRLGASVVNVMIGVHVSQPPKLWDCVLALSDALMDEDIDAMAGRLIPHAMSSTNANAIHILIGRKL